jgi:hypothetical protein
MHQATCPSGGMDSSNPSLQAAGGTSGSITMVMVFVRSFVLFVQIINP